MAGFCWGCAELTPMERSEAPAAPTLIPNDFSGWLNRIPLTQAWGHCDGCGRHLFDNFGKKVCGLPTDATGWGDPNLGCGHCHAWRREQNLIDAEGEDVPTRNHHRWKDWEDDMIIRMNKAGKTSRVIGSTLKRSPRMVAERLNKLGHRKFRDRSLAAYRGMNTTRWTPAEDSTMITLISEFGYSNPQVAAFLGRTPAAINRRLYKINKSDVRANEACRQCGDALVNTHPGRKRKFCSSACCDNFHHERRRAARRHQQMHPEPDCGQA